MNTIDSIGLITVFLLVLLSLFLITQPSARKPANVLFACFLLVVSFEISALFLGDFYASHESLNRLRVSAFFLQMPLFYLYVKKTCFEDFQLQKRELLHILPFVLFLVAYLQIEINFQVDIWHIILSEFQYFAYMIWVFFQLRAYKQLHLKQHSLQNKTYRWLLTTSLLFLLGHSLVLFRGVFEVLNDFEGLSFLNIGISFFALCIITWFVLQTMRNPGLFIQVSQRHREKAEYLAEREAYLKELTRLEAYMQTEKPYLNDSLSLDGLANQTNIPAKHLSFLINQVSGKHFFDFVNTYRVEEAKRHLKESDFTVQQIMYEVGFNSKSSFNTAFKKNTNTTPSAYRKAPQNTPQA